MEHPKTILRRYSLTAKKSLGQNFISDERLLARISEPAELSSTDQVLEIGPGLGALTRFLAEDAKRVVAVEIDDRFVPVLAQELGAYHNLELVHGDILEFQPDQYFDEPYKVAGNVPYYITGAILRHLLAAQPSPERMILTVQQEVAERIIALPGDMSLLAVMVQFYMEAELLFRIKAGAFWPKPSVDSAVLRLMTRRSPLLPSQQVEAFFRLVRMAFSQKRKQLQKNLRALNLSKDQLEEAFRMAGIDGQRRAQTLSMEEWRALYEATL